MLDGISSFGSKQAIATALWQKYHAAEHFKQNFFQI
jgi:hypothetical protein